MPTSTPTAPLIHAVVEMTEEDVAALAASAPATGTSMKSIAALKHSHHALARCLADNLTPEEASVATGYSLSRIYTLQADPTFAGLVHFYRERKSEIYASLHERLKLLSLDVVETIHQKVLEQGEAIPLEDLLKLAELALDRSGAGPTQNHAHVHHLTSETIQSIKEAANGALSQNDAPTVIVRPSRTLLSPPPAADPASSSPREPEPEAGEGGDSKPEEGPGV